MAATRTTNLYEPTVLVSDFASPLTGDDADPPTVDLQVFNPAGLQTTIPKANLDHTASGEYRYVLIPGTSIAGTAGVWRYRFNGGPNAEAEWCYLVVDSGPRRSLCSAWCEPADLDGCSGIPDAVDAATRQRMIETASDLLWRWSGYRFGGICRDKVRPSAQTVYVSSVGRPSLLQGAAGSWSAWWAWESTWGHCACQQAPHGTDCGCQRLSSVGLGRAPIRGIVAVTVDGTVLPSSAYQVRDYRWLDRIDGDVWPCCQDLTAADTETDTWSVDFFWGELPPESGRTAAIDLAADLCRACGGGDCAIPERVQQLVRQGTTIRMQDVAQSFGRDLKGNLDTGVRSANLFLSAFPHTEPGMLWSPDMDVEASHVGTAIP